jgi:hypothetical protein
MSCSMKQKIQLVTKTTSLIKLKTAYLYGASFVVLANILGAILTLSLNAGIPENAAAATKNSYLHVTSVDLDKNQFVANNLAGNISDFQPGKTIMIYQTKIENIISAGASVSTATSSDHGKWESAVISSVDGSGPYTITVSSLLNSYSAEQGIQLVSVSK